MVRGVKKAHHARMPQLCQRFNFIFEELLKVGVRRDLRVNHLDDNLATRLQVAREIHRPHAPLAEEALCSVSVEEN
jgi:hypothetical protein